MNHVSVSIVASNMAESGEKATLGVDDMTMPELRDVLSEVNLSVKGSLAILRNRLRKARINRVETSNAGRDDEDADDMDDDEEDDNVDVDSLSREELITRLQRLGLKTTGNKITLRADLRRALQPDDEDENEDDSGSNSSREETAALRAYRRKIQGDKIEKHRADAKTRTDDTRARTDDRR